MNKLLTLDERELKEHITQNLESENTVLEEVIDALQEAENRGFETIGEVTL